MSPSNTVTVQGLELTLSRTPCITAVNNTAGCCGVNTTSGSPICARWSGVDMRSTGSILYGSIEANMALNLPPSGGAVFYIGLYSNSPNWQEIDLGFATGQLNPLKPNNMYMAAASYFNGVLGPYSNINLGQWTDNTQIRNYRLNWTPTSLTWFVDGNEVYKMKNAQIVPNEPLSIRFILRPSTNKPLGLDSQVFLQSLTYTAWTPPSPPPSQ
ncbi:hypothetical protein CEUSTIGMA_g827.t1 [Chlamydomonas eustigma]|uniref:GH16 domain-containing protein n=1 Tax=Chlamydomonas eustigma TaxID=1157962 RepID=A0A250WR93_9CHLO|nr:hypothetical protein CEUSTIGMA_g827.t1 [Chlamydomonas eustigma]|eukprot:GAX73374.1 hypothetical protein CEUSTIGMA_g827.t1 [Chlamydomonas eustigma]